MIDLPPNSIAIDSLAADLVAEVARDLLAERTRQDGHDIFTFASRAQLDRAQPLIRAALERVYGPITLIPQ